MEAVPEEARAKDCVVDPGSGKTLGDEQETTGLVENFARVSENREEGSSGGLGAGSDEKMKGDVNETKRSSGNGVGVENVDDSGVMEDSEMNGVSSLLKMKQDFGEIGKENNISSSDARDVVKELSVHDEEEEEDEIDGGEEEAEHGFHVGDFVWGKIKSHPWWPGRVYDSSDASDLALKIKQKGRLLVAYFGDGTFAWCHPSQLKPFVENFREFSRVSNWRVFVIAVEEAVEEMGRHVECMVTCGCVGKECLNGGLVRPAAANAGIKEGALVPEIRREIFSCLEFEPEEILRDAKAFAKTVTLSDLLEFEALKRKISAFFRSKGGYSLAEYHEPQPIQGLEDNNVEQAVKLPGSKGSVGEDGLNPGESDHRSLEKCSGFPENRMYHRRKQKSIAEILETDTNNRAKIEEETAQRNSIAGRKKRKRSDEVKGDAGRTSNDATSIPRRRRVSEISADATGSQQKQEKPLSRKRKKKSLDVDNDGNGKTEEATLLEEDEKKKTLDSENDVDSTPLASLRKRIKIDVSNVEKDSGKGCETKVQTPNDSLSRERKRSKYLSPPYTTEFSRKGKRSEIEAESMKVSSQARVGERMNNAAGNIIRTTNEETPADKPGDAADDDTGHLEATNELRKAAEFLRLGAPPDELKDLIRTAALSPQYAKDDCSGDLIREFVSIYRSFTYHDGANSKIPWKQDLDIEKEKEGGKSKKQREGKSEKRPKSKENSAETKKQVLSASPKSPNERRKKKKPYEASAPEPSEPKKTSTEIEYVKEKLEEMKSMVGKSEGTMTKELKMKLENEMRNLLKKVSKMAVLSS